MTYAAPLRGAAQLVKKGFDKLVDGGSKLPGQVPRLKSMI